MLPILAGGFLFTGCEVTEVDRRPVAYHRYDHDRSDSYYRGRSDYYDRNPSYRTRSVYRDGYYERSRPAQYSYGYERTRSPYYRSSVNLTRDTTVRRRNVNNVYVDRTNVVRKGSSGSYRAVAVSNEKGRGKGDKKHKNKDRD